MDCKAAIANWILWHHHKTFGPFALGSVLLLVLLCPEKGAELLCSLLAVQQCAKQGVLPLRRGPEGSPCTARAHQGMEWAHFCGIQMLTQLSPHLRALLTTRSRCFSHRRAEGGKWAAWCCSSATHTLVFLWNPGLHSNRKCYYCFLTRDYSDKRSLHPSVK